MLLLPLLCHLPAVVSGKKPYNFVDRINKKSNSIAQKPASCKSIVIIHYLAFGEIKTFTYQCAGKRSDEIMKKSGIYRYVLSGDLRDLSFRTFDKKQKREAYERQQGICPHCRKHFELEEMEADHITPWKEGGTTVADNCQMLCRNCNRVKGAR